MRALVITTHGNPDVLKVQERPDPRPAHGEVLVRVRAAGVNFADVMARMGLYPDAPKPPSVVGYEFAGEVEGTGARVMGGSRFGAYAEQVAVSEAQLLPLPDDWSFEEGAAFPVNYATAYAGLIRYGAVHAGERVLLHAAAGGVGIAATQIAKILGAEVYGTASASKHDAIRGFGVDHPIDYRANDFVTEVRRISGEEQPLDLVMDALGGRNWKKSFSLLRAGGRLVPFGASQLVSGDKRSIPTALRTLAETPRFNPIKLASESKAVIGLNMLKLWDSKGSLDEFIEPLAAWVGEGRVRPIVAQAFPLEQGPDAHRFLQERKNVGKVVLTL
ncbi:MAG TPA: medium chain dehydrogenase/reductase family protein [Thermoleophilaceae bacterium]|nr:medium chain dehydrogenase/reductase family protein [Thermoleophilaceae bacterium]